MRSTITVVVRALLALTLAYVLILQGLLGSASASAQIAIPGLMQTLCSGVQVPDAAPSDDDGHHGMAQSSCCTWGAALAFDPIVPPTGSSALFPYRARISQPVAFGQVTQVAILFRVATTQGSRAPPDLDA